LFINLIDANGKVLAAKPFDPSNGSYAFNYGDGIRASTSYQLVLSQVEGKLGEAAPSADLPAGCSNVDDIDSTANGVIDVTMGTQNKTEVNFGVGTPATTVKIGSRIWIEDDNDGDASTGKITKPEAGLVVTATAADGTKYTGKTDANGDYSIDVPANSTYTVTAEAPKGTCPSEGCDDSYKQDNDVTDTTTENDKSHDSAKGTSVTVGTEDNMTVDFGFCPITVVTGADKGGSISYLLLSMLGMFGLRRRLNAKNNTAK
jgi:hypothetical protein